MRTNAVFRPLVEGLHEPRPSGSGLVQLLSIAPKRAQECSHGWNAAPRRETRGSESLLGFCFAPKGNAVNYYTMNHYGRPVVFGPGGAGGCSHGRSAAALRGAEPVVKRPFLCFLPPPTGAAEPQKNPAASSAPAGAGTRKTLSPTGCAALHPWLHPPAPVGGGRETRPKAERSSRRRPKGHRSHSYAPNHFVLVGQARCLPPPFCNSCFTEPPINRCTA